MEGQSWILARIDRERFQYEDKLRAWAASAHDLAIVSTYFKVSRILVLDEPVGYRFAQLLCEDLNIGPERVLKMADLLPEGDAKDHLEAVAAELVERGGG